MLEVASGLAVAGGDPVNGGDPSGEYYAGPQGQACSYYACQSEPQPPTSPSPGPDLFCPLVPIPATPSTPTTTTSPPAHWAVDTNIVIWAVDDGQFAAVEAELDGAIPEMPMPAFDEYQAGGRSGVPALTWLASMGGGTIPYAGTANQAEQLVIDAYVANTTTKKNPPPQLSLEDAQVYLSAKAAGFPLLTGDSKFFNWLESVRYPSKFMTNPNTT